jgi:hypothetical protein
MNARYAAREIAGILVLEDDTKPPLAQRADDALARGDFGEAAEWAARQFSACKVEFSPSTGYSIWALDCIDTERAADWFENARVHFEQENNWHGLAISDYALGRTRQMQGVDKEAVRSYARSLSVCQSQAEMMRMCRDSAREHLYKNLVNRLLALLETIGRPLEPRLIPVVEAYAGVPLYTPGDDWPYTTSTVLLDKSCYRLLNHTDRLPGKVHLHQNHNYFVTEVRGDSMKGTGIKIRPGDRLLIQQQDSWPDNGTVCVLQEEDRAPMVKIVFRTKKLIRLVSANPRYSERVYAPSGSGLRMLGIVKAILEPVDG